MMNNPIVLGAAVLIFAYVVTGVVLPADVFRAVMAALMATMAAAASVLWFEGASRVIREGRVEAHRRAVLGLFLIASGASFAGLYSLAFNIAGRPPLWSQYPIWPVNQALAAAGFYLVCSSPQEVLPGVPRKRFWMLIVAGVMLFLAGYFVASQAPDMPQVPDLSGYWR